MTKLKFRAFTVFTFLIVAFVEISWAAKVSAGALYSGNPLSLSASAAPELNQAKKHLTWSSRHEDGVPTACVRYEREWTAVEHRIWNSICSKAGEEPRHHCDADHFERSEPAVVRGTFLRTVLLSQPYKERLAAQEVVVLDNLNVRGILDLSRHTLPTLIFNRVIAQQINLEHSTVKGDVEFCRSQIDNVNVSNATVGGDVQFQGLIQPPSTILINSASVSGEIDVKDSNVKSFIVAGSGIGRSIRLDDSKFKKFRIQATKVGGDLVLTNVHILSSDDPNWNGSRIRWTTIGRELRFDSTTIDGNLVLEGTSVGTNLYFSGGQFSDVDARTMTINGFLRIDTPCRRHESGAIPDGPLVCMSVWENGSRLDLSDTAVGRIESPFSLSAWPDRFRLTGFSVGSFASTYDTNSELTSAWYPQWLARGTDDYASEPYREITKFLQNAGQNDAANAVAYAAKDRERIDAWNNKNFLTWGVLWMSKILVGYGYQIGLSLAWAFALVIIGAIIFRKTEEARVAHMPWGVIYSLEMLLPVVKLRKANDFDVSGRARYYFYFHKLAGWILTTFILAALSGLTK